MNTGPSRSSAEPTRGFEVKLVHGHDVGTLDEHWRELRDLGAHCFQVAPRLGRRAVQYVDQRFRALDMAQESLAKACPLCRAFDQTRDVGEHEAKAIDLGDAKLRIERCEGIVGDFGARRSERTQERGFARIRRADEADVGDQLQVERDLQLVALQPLLRVVRRAPRCALEVDVATAPGTAPRDHRLGAWCVQVRQHPAVSADGDRSHRDFQCDVGSVASGLATAGPRNACFGVPARAALVQREIADVVCRVEDYRAAAPAITAVRTASRHKRFASERSRTPAAVTAAHNYASGIDEMATVSLCRSARSAES